MSANDHMMAALSLLLGQREMLLETLVGSNSNQTTGPAIDQEILDFHKLIKEGNVKQASEKATPDMLAKPGKKGRLAVHYAAISGQIEMMDMLQRMGDDIDALDQYGASPLHYAVFHHHLATVSHILDQSTARLNHFGNSAPRLNHFGNSAPRYIGSETPLLLAVHEMNLEMIEFLLGKGADPKMLANGLLALNRACERGQLEIVKLLVEAGADPNARGRQGYTSLHEAAKNNHLPVVQYLLSRGADYKATDDKGSTPVDLASKKACKETLRFFLTELDTDLVMRNSAMGLAAVLNFHDIVPLLAEKGHNLLGSPSQNEPTPLHIASMENHYQFARNLLECDPTIVSATNQNGSTPLHTAATKGNTPLIRLYLEKGADPELRNKKGLRPIDITIINNDVSCFMIFYRAGSLPDSATLFVYSRSKSVDRRIFYIFDKHGLFSTEESKMIALLSSSVAKKLQRYAHADSDTNIQRAHEHVPMGSDAELELD